MLIYMLNLQSNTHIQIHVYVLIIECHLNFFFQKSPLIIDILMNE